MAKFVEITVVKANIFISKFVTLFTMIKIIILSILCLVGFVSFGVDDSTGVILKNNKVFILHKVEAGQGLYGVARRYKTVWTIVRDANPGSETKIVPGQI